MLKTRREVLKSGGGMTLLALLAAAGWLKPGDAAAQAWNKGAFEAKSLDEAMKAFGGGAPAQSKDIAFVADARHRGERRGRADQHHERPAEDGVDRDPDREEPEHAGGELRHPAGHRACDQHAREDGTESNVYALVKADGKYYVASKEIKVTLGGCGG